MYNRTHKHLTGQELYNLEIAGDWNHVAIKQLNDGVLSATKTELALMEANFLNRVVNELLIRGSIIIMDKKVIDGIVLYIEEFEDEEVAYQLIADNYQKFIKVWVKTASNVTVIKYAVSGNFDTLDELKQLLAKATPVETIPIPSSDGILFIQNGQGVLKTAEATLLRLSLLSDILSETISKDALRWFVSSYAADVRQLNAKADGPFGVIPDGASFEHMFDGKYVDSIFTEINMLLPSYRDAVSNYTITPGESGIARYLGLQGYINKVKHTQKLAAYIFETYGITLEFDDFITRIIMTEVQGNANATV